MNNFITAGKFFLVIAGEVKTTVQKTDQGSCCSVNLEVDGGAGASIPEMIILGSMFKKKLVLAFAPNVFFVAIVAGYPVEWLVY